MAPKEEKKHEEEQDSPSQKIQQSKSHPDKPANEQSKTEQDQQIPQQKSMNASSQYSGSSAFSFTLSELDSCIHKSKEILEEPVKKVEKVFTGGLHLKPQKATTYDPKDDKFKPAETMQQKSEREKLEQQDQRGKGKSHDHKTQTKEEDQQGR
ncbi:MAG: hypothetical protein Q9162_005398 [Coniocarpon cinnabarinum]